MTAAAVKAGGGGVEDPTPGSGFLALTGLLDTSAAPVANASAES